MAKRNLTKFGREVNKRLVELNMTQKALAQKIGVSEVYLSMVLRGHRSGKKYIDVIVKTLGLQDKNF